MALSTVLGKEIHSVYSDVPWNYRGLYNTSVRPAGDNTFNFPGKYKTISSERIIIFWTRDGNLSHTDHMFVANHGVPLFPKSHIYEGNPDDENSCSQTKKRKTQQKLDSFFGKSAPSKYNNTQTDTVINPSVPSEGTRNAPSYFIPGENGSGVKL